MGGGGLFCSSLDFGRKMDICGCDDPFLWFSFDFGRKTNVRDDLQRTCPPFAQ